MHDFVIGERRAVPRRRAEDLPAGYTLAIPGTSTLDVVDTSDGGACVRGSAALRPGRVVTVRTRERTGADERHRPALVVRCWVVRLGRASVTFESGLSWERVSR